MKYAKKLKKNILYKYIEMANYVADNTPFPRVREIKDSMNDMEWTMGYKDKLTNRPKGTGNSVLGVTTKNDPHRARGKRAVLIEFEEVGSFTSFLTTWAVVAAVIGIHNILEIIVSKKLVNQ